MFALYTFIQSILIYLNLTQNPNIEPNDINNSKIYDVVIIGGGLSGLTAAFEILRYNQSAKIIVLEAGDRIGGRLYAVPMKVDDNQFEQFDIGGMWVGRTQRSIMQLLRDLNINTYPQYTSGLNIAQRTINGTVYRYADDQIPGVGYGPDEVNDLFDELDDMAMKLPSISTNTIRKLQRTSFAKWVHSRVTTSDGYQAGFLLIDTIFETSMDDVSLYYVLYYIHSAGGLDALATDYGDGAQSFRINGTAFGLCKKLETIIGLNTIELNSPVKLVQYSQNLATVTTENGVDYVSNAVIFAISPYQASKIVFNPPLPSNKQHILRHFRPRSRGLKFVITFKYPFWRDKNLSGQLLVPDAGVRVFMNQTIDMPHILLFDDTDANRNGALAGFTIATNISEYVRRELILKRLESYLGSEVFDNVLDYAEKDWTQAQYIEGCVATLPNNKEFPEFENQLRRPNGSLFWAGTETAIEWVGFMNGAVEAGQRAAYQAFKHVVQYKI